MTSVMNGARNGVANRFTTPTTTAGDASASTALTLNPNTSFNTFSLPNAELDFGDLFPHSTWGDLEPNAWAETTRPDSCQSITPVSTPTRPPSAPNYSPAHQTLPSPFTAQQSPSAPNPPTPANPYNSVNNFPFSPIQENSYPVEEQKDSKDNVLQESGRLRNLLLKPPVSASDSTSDADQSKNQILKNLLDQEDEDDKNIETRGASPRSLMGNRNNAMRQADQPKQSNNMLLKVCLYSLFSTRFIQILMCTSKISNTYFIHC